jgi:hypothetical protein
MQQTASGRFNSSHDGQVALLDEFSYPLNINFTFLNPNGTDCKYFLSGATSMTDSDSFSLGFTSFDHSYNRDLMAMSIVVQNAIENRQLAGA